MMIAGVTMVVIGAAGLATGIAVAAEGNRRVQIYGPGGYLHDRRPDEGMRDAGIAVAVVTGVAFAVGIPVWAVGAKKIPVNKQQTQPAPGSAEPPRPAAFVRLGAGNASFSLSF